MGRMEKETFAPQDRRVVFSSVYLLVVGARNFPVVNILYGLGDIGDWQRYINSMEEGISYEEVSHNRMRNVCDPRIRIFFDCCRYTVGQFQKGYDMKKKKPDSRPGKSGQQQTTEGQGSGKKPYTMQEPKKD